jgi:hypothetical protein
VTLDRDVLIELGWYGIGWPKLTRGELVYLAELHDRRNRGGPQTGWLYAGDPDDYERDMTEDRCCACFKHRTKDLHDPCIANLPGVLHACCGHGKPETCWVTGYSFGKLTGPAAARMMRQLGGHPPQAAFLLAPFRAVVA